MAEVSREELLYAEVVSSGYKWIAPLFQEDKGIFCYPRGTFKRYSIVPSKATLLDCDFVRWVTESEFYFRWTNV